MAKNYSTDYYIKFRISGMREDYPCLPRHSARAALDKIKQLTKEYNFVITSIQERKDKHTKDISLSELEELAKKENSVKE